MFGSSYDDSRDPESRDHEGDPESDSRDPDPDGYGSERDDTPFASRQEQSFMPMTRRDVDHLYDHALRDTSSFLKKHEPEPRSRTTGQQFLSFGEMFVGAVVGGYLSQRFRATSGVVPTGLLLGGIGFGAAQFTQMFGRYSDDVKALAIGSAIASGVIWAAGYGALGAEKEKAKDEGNFPATGNAPPQQLPPQHVQQFPQQPHQLWPAPAYAPYAPAYAPQPAAVPRAPSVSSVPSMADFQELVTRRAA